MYVCMYVLCIGSCMLLQSAALQPPAGQSALSSLMYDDVALCMMT
jgi:hypothetical protein